MPTTSPCTKLELLKTAYYDDFTQLKTTQVAGRATNMWKAKYQLFGENCQVFALGGKQHTYSCRLVAPDEETAKGYYQNAQSVTKQCLGEAWTLEESPRKHDNGMKTTFTNNDANPDEKVTFSTHLVPSSGLFSTTWTLYYYVGNVNQPKSNSH